MTMGERIKNMRLEKNMTQEALGEHLGIQKAAVQKYEKGTVTNIKRDTLLKMAEIFDTSVEFIINGNDVGAEFIAVSPENTIYIPVLADVSAGMGCHAESFDSYSIGYEPVSADEINTNEQYVYMRVKGDSMYPLFIEGDLALVRIQSSVDSGSYAVVLIDECNGVIKKVVYGTDFIELHSVNPMYPPRRFEGSEVSRIRVFGLVKECKRKF